MSPLKNFIQMYKKNIFWPKRMLKYNINSLEGMLSRISEFLHFMVECKYKSAMRIKQAGAKLST